MKSYYRVMLGRKSMYAEECLTGGFIGAGFGIEQDLVKKLPDEWKAFNHEFVPIFLASHPDKTRIGAGLACGSLWVISKGIKIGDVVLSPDGSGSYRVGEVTGEYYYVPNAPQPHRRPVHWFDTTVERASMSDALRNSSGSIGTVCNISGYATEIESLIGTVAAPKVVAIDPLIENAASFVMEKHLEDFLVQNWAHTELGKEFDIFAEDGETVGQQYPTDTGPIDVLAIGKDKKRLLVVELKKGRASDAVVGQVLRYMGYVQEELAESGQTVSGVIIALEDDQRIRRALAMVPTVSFYRYQISFKLMKG